MQKVEGSSPFIRFERKACKRGPFVFLDSGENATLSRVFVTGSVLAVPGARRDISRRGATAPGRGRRAAVCGSRSRGSGRGELGGQDLGEGLLLWLAELAGEAADLERVVERLEEAAVGGVCERLAELVSEPLGDV
jgi:hypothetical protein